MRLLIAVTFLECTGMAAGILCDWPTAAAYAACAWVATILACFARGLYLGARRRREPQPPPGLPDLANDPTWGGCSHRPGSSAPCYPCWLARGGTRHL